MAVQSTGSSHPVLSYTDGIATGMGDAFILVARVLLGSLFFVTAWSGSPNVGYLTSLGLPNPQFWSWVAIAVEYVSSLALILGIGTRYGALLGILYVIVATVIAHRYWTYPPPQQLAQHTNFVKNIAIAGGLLLVFVTGPGRFSIDGMLSGKR
jgi:putative oxidoreductase